MDSAATAAATAIDDTAATNTGVFAVAAECVKVSDHVVQQVKQALKLRMHDLSVINLIADALPATASPSLTSASPMIMLNEMQVLPCKMMVSTKPIPMALMKHTS